MPSLKDPVPRICAIPSCGKEFLPKHRRAKYCSKPCLWKSKNDAVGKKEGGEYRRRRARKYWHANAELMQERLRGYYAKHREERVAKQRQRNQEARRSSPWLSLVRSAARRAKEKGLSFDLTDEWAAARWTGRCEITGIEFCFGKWKGPHTRAATIDKIKPELGYVQSNCRIILQSVNALKGTLSDEDMLETALAIVKFFNPQKETIT